MRWGIEAEFGLVDADGQLVDFAHPRAAELQQLVDGLPDHDDQDLTRGDLAIKWTRWYVEGDERFADDGTFLRCVPKGIETRTPITDSIEAAVACLAELVGQLGAAGAARGLRLTALGHNPVHSTYRPEPPFNAWELAMRGEHEEYDAPEVYMCTYGPDVNLSYPEWDGPVRFGAAARLAAWAPEIVAFSLNAPIVDGEPYGGLSYRTAVRAGRRPTVRIFLPADEVRAGRSRAAAGLAVRPARIAPEQGRIEFKALDAFAQLDRFRAYAALLGGLAQAFDAPAPGDVQPGGAARFEADPAVRLRAAAATGFADDALAARCAVLLEVARGGWGDAPEADLLAPLAADLRDRRVPAHDLLERHSSDAGCLPAITLP